MSKVDQYLKYMRFKSHFKNIPLFSKTIKLIKWKYYRPWAINRWTKKRLADYEKKILGQKGWTDNEKKLLALKDSHKGEMAFVVGNGPSLKHEDLTILHEKGVFCFAMNRINLVFEKTKWRPSCYMAIDRQIYRDGDPTIPSILAENLPIYMIGDKAYEGIPKEILPPNVISFYSQGNSRYKPVNEFGENPVAYLVDGFTVSYSAIQMAYFMGFKKIYLLGIDMNYNKETQRNGNVKQNGNSMSYFDKRYDPDNKNTGFVTGMLEAYQTAKVFSESHGFDIINVSRAGNLDVFKRCDFDELMETLHSKQ